MPGFDMDPGQSGPSRGKLFHDTKIGKTTNTAQAYTSIILEQGRDSGFPDFKETKTKQIQVTMNDGVVKTSSQVVYYQNYQYNDENRYRDVVSYDPNSSIAKVKNAKDQIIDVFLR